MPARQLADPDGDQFEVLADKIMGMPSDVRVRWLSSLAPSDLAIAQRAIARRTALGWRRDPSTMAAHLDSSYRRPNYVAILGEAYRKAASGTGYRAIINLPARIGKSRTCSQWGPAWGLDVYPDSKSMLISYGDELAMENALACRDILLEHADVFAAQLRRDARRRDRFLTEQGGGILARGMGSAIRGFGVTEHGVLVLDDLFKDWIEAHSAQTRERKWNQYRSTIRDRLDTEEAGILHVHHRVHEKDFTGYLIEEQANGGEVWDHIVIPAIAAEGIPDALGREYGEVIDPERFTFEQVQTRWRALGSYVVAAQEQQAPSSQEGTELLRAWFQVDPNIAPPSVWQQGITSWDLKLKDKEEGDYVVGQVWVKAGSAYWLLDQIRGKFDHATTANAVALLAVRHPTVTRHIVEAAGSYEKVTEQLTEPRADYEVTDEMATRLGMTPDERAKVQALRRVGMFGLIPHAAKYPKPVRARAYIAPAAEANQVWLAHDVPGLSLLLDEVAGFPNGMHDDQVDAMSQGIEILSGAGGTISMPGGRVARPRTGRKLNRPSPG